MEPTTMQPPAQPTTPQVPPVPLPPAAQAVPAPNAQQPSATTEVYAEICTQIIKEQALIIGALAIEQASHVPGLMVDPQTHECRIIGDGTAVVESLINKYREFFGNAAVEVCKEAASRFTTRLPAEQLPASLR